VFETAKPFLLSLALGLVLGIERERALSREDGHLAFGSRTFALIAMLGTLAAHVSNGGVGIVLAAFVAAISIAAYLRPRGPAEPGVGTTTEVAAVATFALGWLAHDDVVLAAMLGVIILAVLWLKPRIHRFAHDGLSDKEANAALTFLVIALVVLPLLPNRAVDPWGLFNPSRLWLLFTTIAGVGFAGYIAVRALGPSRGLAAAGFGAGLVSSTAATLSLSRRARGEPDFAAPLAIGIVLANVASAAAQILIIGVSGSSLLPTAGLMIAAPVAVGILGSATAAWWLRRRGGSTPPQAAFELSNPLELESALAMAAIFGVILAISGVASRTLGAAGVIVTAAIAGTSDVHGATLAVATIFGAGSLPLADAMLAILLAFLVNMVVKLGIVAVVGGRRLFLVAAPPMVAMALGALAAFLLLRP